VAAVAAVIVLLASATAVVVRSVVDRRPSPESLLRRVERYTQDHRSARFTGQTEVENRVSDDQGGRVPEEQFSTFTARSTVEGVVAFPDRARFTVRSDGSSSEFLRFGDRAFGRFALGEEQLSTKKWVAFGPEEESEIGPPDAGVTGLDDPTSLPHLIGDAPEPQIVGRDGRGRVVRARVDVADGDERFEELESLTGTLELTARDDGRLDRMVVDVRGEADDGITFDARVDFRFSGWGQAVDIAEPGEADIDATPSVDEERIAAYEDAPLLQPAGIPAGWVLDFADVVPAEDTAEECAQVELAYVDPDDEEGGYLHLYELPVTCADLQPPPGARPFRAGPNQGWLTEDPEEGVQAQLTVGRTVLQADTDLAPAELARVLAQLVPLDFAVTPTPIRGIGSTGPER